MHPVIIRSRDGLNLVSYLSLPAGTAVKRHLAKQGGAGVGQGQAGDLYLEVEFRPHSIYKVEGKDVYLGLPLAPWEAALGTTLKVPTLEGRVELKIKPGMQSGQKMRLKGRGMQGNVRGDQLVEVMIQVPPANDEEAREFYRQMQQQFDFDPRAF